ncbi:MAG: S8 family peptidase [Lentimicrobiaceae bacterium]|nr:S8 family peptidase [Lentimicrobiaceae bacterium]MCO5264475.1 S8 family peptidase [Lentimicrobium sp.]
MRTITAIGIFLAAFLQANAQNQNTIRETGQMIVQMKPLTDAHAMQNLLDNFSEAGAGIEKKLSGRMNIWLLHFDESSTNANILLEKVRKHPAVQFAQFNHLLQERELIPDDPSFSNQWALQNTGQMSGTPGADIKATYAWDITTSGLTANGDTIVVAMIDGGVDLTHSDLHLWKNRLEIPSNGIDDDENGYIDDYDGWNAYTNSGAVTPHDHGTHVAGIACAIGNNGNGVSGVAFNTQLMPVSGSSTNEATAVAAYDYVFEMRKRYNETNGAAGAFIVASNSSFGIDGGNPANYPLWSAIYDSMGSVGILNVASTANRGWDIDINGDIPTALTNESVVAVTNTNNLDMLSNIAGWGLTSIDLGAPGTNIYSTRQGNTYGYKTGTSMSSPFVTGSIALMYAAADESTLQLYKENPSIVAYRFKRFLIASVDTLASLEGKCVSGGRLNLLNTLQMVQNQPYFLASPDVLNFDIAPETHDSVSLLIQSFNAETNPIALSFPDSIQWLTLSDTSVILHGSGEDAVMLYFNSSNLETGQYTTTLTMTDYFLNQVNINIHLNVEDGVATRITSGLVSALKTMPNPFANETNIVYSLEKASQVHLAVFDLNGRKVSDLYKGFATTGSHTIKWNSNLTPGIYMIKLVCGDNVQVLKVVKR